MPFDTFDEGIEPGGLREKYQIKLLICYILANIKDPLTTENVIEVLQKNGLANYFEAADAFADLVKKKNIIASDEKQQLYTVSESGKTISRRLSDELPASVKDRAMGAVLMLLEQQKTEKENTVSIKKTDKGYQVSCNISGGTMDLFSFSIYVPEQSQARTIKRNFHKNPSLIYQVMLSMLTGSKDLALEVLEPLSKEKSKTKNKHM